MRETINFWFKVVLNTFLTFPIYFGKRCSTPFFKSHWSIKHNFFFMWETYLALYFQLYNFIRNCLVSGSHPSVCPGEEFRSNTLSTVVTGQYHFRFRFRFWNWLRLSGGSGYSSRTDSDYLPVPSLVLEMTQISFQFRVLFCINFAHVLVLGFGVCEYPPPHPLVRL